MASLPLLVITLSSMINVPLEIASTEDMAIHSVHILRPPNGVDHSIVYGATHDAIKAWEDANPDIMFHVVDYYHEADVTIVYEYHDYQFGSYVKLWNTIYIGLGGDCNGVYKHYGFSIIKHTTAHEIGHYFGYGHTDDKDSVMYSPVFNPSKDAMESNPDVNIPNVNIPNVIKPQFKINVHDNFPDYC